MNPWSRGDGHMTVTVSLPIVLSPIVKRLRSKRVLSRRIAEYLWASEGVDDLEADEKEVIALLAQKALIEEQIKEKEVESLAKRELAVKAERLKEIQEDIDRYRKLYNVTRQGSSLSTTPGVTVGLIDHWLSIIHSYGGPKGFVIQYESWKEEKESLIQEIATTTTTTTTTT